VDACIHAAWYVEPGKYAHAAENVAWVGTSMRLLEALSAGGCARAVYIGTCFEYDHRTGYLAESSPTRPWTLYGAAKLSTALMGAELAEQWAWASAGHGCSISTVPTSRRDAWCRTWFGPCSPGRMCR
jgi:nucleoside-diphosphate-sugar epimerase